MRKLIFIVFIFLCCIENCFADEFSEQVKIVFRALEKVNSMSIGAIDDSKNFLEAVEIADAEVNYLYKIDHKKNCSKVLMKSKGTYNIAANWLQAENYDQYVKMIKKAHDELQYAYSVCHIKKYK